MDLTQEIRRLWGDALAPETADIDPAVPASTRTYLTEVGLPVTPLFGLTFARGAALTPFERAGRRLLSVAEFPGWPFWVCDLDTEALWSWPPSSVHTGPARFINSGVDLFMLTAGRFTAMLTALHDHDGDPVAHITALCDGFRRDLAAADPPAAAADALWSAEVDELQGGHGA
ncbi:hypothetical protein Acy02nite_91800 [Actinoplanes cyaneus]|uniref:Uncharacterized protein n=1 Tax=Actinoplanes cyaneus TaxID=52696 RepID=A0A919MD39_9ACTN|nr:SUKH-4 family immunity protein [Actinoplanes cyaneus]MCW2144569.1 SUKH-4 immunity protein [Actinoplanes cyaneus]GID71299.1 hypothetical protein Acy02nite_91800 [Actinoplanes cyaneus]